jgi:hypothetical protein
VKSLGFGEIIIEMQSSDVDIETYKQNQAQQRIVSIPVRSVNDVTLTLKQRINTGLRNVAGFKVVIHCFP